MKVDETPKPDTPNVTMCGQVGSFVALSDERIMALFQEEEADKMAASFGYTGERRRWFNEDFHSIRDKLRMNWVRSCIAASKEVP